MKTKKIVSTAKRSAKVVSMVTTMVVSMGLSADDVRAAQAAYEDMLANEYKDKAVVVGINTYDTIA